MFNIDITNMNKLKNWIKKTNSDYDNIREPRRFLIFFLTSVMIISYFNYLLYIKDILWTGPILGILILIVTVWRVIGTKI
jgi:uncharacterized membrane protein (DUF485 family)